MTMRLKMTYNTSGYKMKLTHSAQKILSLSFVCIALTFAIYESTRSPRGDVFFAWVWVVILSLSAWAVFLKRQ